MTENLHAIAEEAARIVSGDRRDTYGSPERSFAAIADLWQGYLRANGYDNVIISALDVARMMTLFKMGRRLSTPDHRDSIVDGIGYTLLEYEIATADEGCDLAEEGAE